MHKNKYSGEDLVQCSPKKPGVMPLGLEGSIHVEPCAVNIWVDLISCLTLPDHILYELDPKVSSEIICA